MIRHIFSEVLAREASRYLTKRRIRKERELIIAVAKQMRLEMGLPPDNRL